MSHMVIYRGSDGKPGYHQTDDIHDAVGFVEQMRNEQGVEHARIFRLEEVVFQYKPYYRVELADSITPGDEGASSEADKPAVTAGDTAGSSNGNGDHGVATGSSSSDGNGDSMSEVKHDVGAETKSERGGDSGSSSDEAVTGPAAKRSLFGR